MTTRPQRIQRQRVKGWRKPANTVCVSRPSRWGNPFAARPVGDRWQVIDLGDRSGALREEPQFFPERHYAAVFAVRFFELHTGPMGLYEYSGDDLRALSGELGGRNLACWCPLDQPCHADSLLRIAQRLQKEKSNA